ncbi:DNA-protecting protein DprA [Candidatus Microgenomates bacterium]|nr:MAG: DNA-protecting protein DprA [Candidatus Microgenomates bacterium]
MKYNEYVVQKIKKGSKNYPKTFMALPDPPAQIYVRGRLGDDMLTSSIAIVGSRRMSRYGEDVVSLYASSCAQASVTVVSGFMYGIDTAAHTYTLENGGITIAVLGSGLNQCYPPENNELYTKILQAGGAVISEYEPEAKPKPWMFAKRNRLVVALSTIGVLIAEAAENSGTLITANYALKLGVPIFAVPGAITSVNAKGVNELIKGGKAQMTTSPMDVLQGRLFTVKSAQLIVQGESDDVLRLLSVEPLSIDEISMKTGKDVVSVLSKMSELSINGHVVEVGGRYQLAA